MLARADQLLDQGHYLEAVKVLQRTVQEYPDAAWAWVMMGRAHLGKKDFSAAEQALGKATALGPELAEAPFYLGPGVFLPEELCDRSRLLSQGNGTQTGFRSGLL